MEIIQGSHFNRPSVVTIGNFDGVHIGHQALIKRAKELAQHHGWALVALTFEPHPASVLGFAPAEHHLITPTDVKMIWLEHYGVDFVKILRFDHELSVVPPFPFLTLEVQTALNAQAVVVGFNFTFGAEGTGRAETLSAWGAATGVEAVIVNPVDTPNGLVSSSMVRKNVRQGQIAEANALLGHPFTVRGVAAKGAGRGHTIGTATLNVVPSDSQVMPEYGVFAGRLAVEGDLPGLRTSYPAVANWGVRPTFGGQVPVLEIHALDSALPDLYGKEVRFDFAAHLRAEIKFPDVESLQKQIREDMEKTRRLLS